MNLRPPMCERARSWASLRLDGELSELESAFLDAHLSRCSPCRAFAHGVEEVAAALAAACLERPAPLALLLPRRRRHHMARAAQSAAAATLVAAIGAGALVLGTTGHAPAVGVKRVAMVSGVESLDKFREFRRAQLIEQDRSIQNPAIPRNRQVPGESV